MVIEWEDKDKKKQLWNLILGSSKIMNDWVGLINSIINNNYSKEKYDEMAKSNISTLSNQNKTPKQNFLHQPKEINNPNNFHNQETINPGKSPLG